jgi:coenzyme F420-reducing hydrogenase beta subunit
MSWDKDEQEQAQEDAAVAAIMTRLLETGHYDPVVALMNDDERALVEESLDRHAARCREAGIPGW